MASEPLQRLPASRVRGNFARYATQKPPFEDRTIVNVGGYERLRVVVHDAGVLLSRDRAGLLVLDRFIDASPESVATLADEIGMFYGDVLTHNIRGSYWTVRGETPSVRFSGTHEVDVITVARRRLRESAPSLVENYAHIRELLRAH